MKLSTHLSSKVNTEIIHTIFLTHEEKKERNVTIVMKTREEKERMNN